MAGPSLGRLFSNFLFFFLHFSWGGAERGLCDIQNVRRLAALNLFLGASVFGFVLLFWPGGGGTTPPSLIVCRQDGRPKWWMSDKRFNGASVARRFLFRHFDGCPFVSDGHRRVAIGHKNKNPFRPANQNALFFFKIPPAVHVTGISIDWCFFFF